MFGKEPPNKGKRVSLERIELMRANAKYGKDNNLSKPVIAYNKETLLKEYEFESISDAARFFKMSNETAIIACLKGRTKTSAGFIWKYKEK